jgi:hypothetical protein
MAPSLIDRPNTSAISRDRRSTEPVNDFETASRSI